MPYPELAGLADLGTIATAAFARLWRQVDGTAEQVRDTLARAVLPPLVDVYGSAAAALAADWYEELRLRDGVPGSFRALTAAPPPIGRFEALAGWGTGPLFQPVADRESAFGLLSGGLQRVVVDMHRQTVTQSAIADPKAVGWRRVGVGENCEFCSMLIGRGYVYTRGSVKFRSHDHCNCAAAPEWR